VFTLDGAGRHRWRPIAPCARVEVALDRPALRWAGNGYLDTNTGDEPLEDAFTGWTWSRASLRDGTVVLYDVDRRHGEQLTLALCFDATDAAQELAPPPVARLPTTRLWRIARTTRADRGYLATVAQTLEDTPFYARSVVSTHLLSEPVSAVHESLSLDRFRAGWVQLLLPFRMPRVP
jgi:carotenoid 1,2-hydratase